MGTCKGYDHVPEHPWVWVVCRCAWYVCACLGGFVLLFCLLTILTGCESVLCVSVREESLVQVMAMCTLVSDGCVPLRQCATWSGCVHVGMTAAGNASPCPRWGLPPLLQTCWGSQEHRAQLTHSGGSQGRRPCEAQRTCGKELGCGQLICLGNSVLEASPSYSGAPVPVHMAFWSIPRVGWLTT